MSLIARLLLVGTQRTGSAFQKVVWKDNDRHQPHDDDSSTANLANREPGSTTVFAAATIVKRPLAGAMISCRASSIRISAIGSPAATIDPSAMNHRSTIPSGNILGVSRTVFGRACLLGDAAFVVRPHTAAAAAKAADDAMSLAAAIHRAGRNVDAALAGWQASQIERGQELLQYGVALGQRWAKAR
jgi:hypothetical protein